MKLPLLLPLPLSLILNIFLFLIVAPTPQALNDENYTRCSQLYECGSIGHITYPFWGNGRPDLCGLQGFKLECDSKTNQSTFYMDKQPFSVLAIDPVNPTMSIVRSDLLDNICPENYDDTTIDAPLFKYSPDTVYLTLYYSCDLGYYSNIKEWRTKFTCESGGGEGFFVNESSLGSVQPQASQKCNNTFTVPVFRNHLQMFWTGEIGAPQELVSMGFEVVYELETGTKCEECKRSGGMCGTNATHQFTCFCKDGPQMLACPPAPGPGSNKRRNLGIGFGVAGCIFLIMVLGVFIYRRRKKKRNQTSSRESRNISSFGSAPDLEKSGNFYGVQVFNYDELAEATNNFDEQKELGDGGFGTVYQGKLRDGRVVAVKRLYERNFRRVEQFITEVEILTQLHHPNLVTLYGCTSRHCRELILVYEYIPNGTVADHLHGEEAKPGLLSWARRMSIAVETANALAFLHASGVIHRDVKTNNILLDNNFCVKVADFGLSRLFPTNVTHVSTAPQGTPGYVDPEYHQCYQLTKQSDVYSFGVVLIELISSMPAVDITRHRHDINLSTLAINKIQNHALHELVDPHLGYDSDFKVSKMINGVAELAFQCLQHGRDMRPSMQEVLEVLEGIQSEGFSAIVAEEVDIPTVSVVLLKSDPPSLSPDSVMTNLISRDTTPNTSS